VKQYARALSQNWNNRGQKYDSWRVYCKYWFNVASNILMAREREAGDLFDVDLFSSLVARAKFNKS